MSNQKNQSNLHNRPETKPDKSSTSTYGTPLPQKNAPKTGK